MPPGEQSGKSDASKEHISKEKTRVWEPYVDKKAAREQKEQEALEAREERKRQRNQKY